MDAQDARLSSYDFQLPPAAIAQTPLEPRHRARMLCVEPQRGWQDRTVAHWPQLLRPGDLLILNDTRVLKARLRVRRASGGMAEVLVLEPHHSGCWVGLVKPGRRIRTGDRLQLLGAAEAELSPVDVEVAGDHPASGGRLLRFPCRSPAAMEQLLNRYGEMPLPPYIRSSSGDGSRYQTTFARRPGAVAAPTAGLHLSVDLRQRLEAAGILTSFVTLHVGLGTFRPLQQDDLREVSLHSEQVEIGADTVRSVQQAQASGGRVIAVGTTSCRALEGVATRNGGRLMPYEGPVDLCMRPGYRLQVVEGLLTNFHLPRSSLLLLVSALIGRQRLLQLYREALGSGYRFYSFGDAMWIPPEAVLPQVRPPGH